jgi:hypothetical protein
MKGVPNPEKFLDPAILPAGPVRVAALDGENADPANGVTLETGLFARSLWREMAYRLAGRDGYERVRASDERHLALRISGRTANWDSSVDCVVMDLRTMTT